jgi:hypothetical protein
MTQSKAHKHERFRYDGAILPAWLSAAKRLNGAMWLSHVSQQHPDEVKPSLERMCTEDSGMVVAETYDV